MATMTKIGDMLVVAQADIASKDADINSSSPKIGSHQGVVKFAGMQVIMTLTAGGHAFAVSQGDQPTSKWTVLDGTTDDITPA